ncbi:MULTISPECIES: YdgH/BhsA/McbA family protein [Citrobacter]|uniref:DUF1471 domain-containing protein n=1 Tax=Citrobacter TaxID=544 RepID=UPI002574F166|nr:DUF1471 domain-containing protein [Citrobacter sp. Ce006]MDM3317969.1 DUF1471 domain-containing protein [Citrobacter sp. Ce006]
MTYRSFLLPAAFFVFFSNSAFSTEIPQVIDVSSAHDLEKIGLVSIRGVGGSLDDAVAELQEKAAQLGAGKVRIVSLDTPGDSSLWRGNAVAYR